MSIIQINNLSFTYDGSFDPVFENVSFQIDTDWKLGFIGRNGKGKTTFLKLLTGAYGYSGSITSSAEFEYFPFPVKDRSRMTLEILEEINPVMEQWELIRELSLLDTDAEILYRPFSTLSFGEQTKSLLAALFLKEHAFLLIDEPTNHLDGPARDKVADYLSCKKGFILVSHDRDFLDRCVDHVLVLNRQTIEVRKGNFSSWYADKTARDSMEIRQNEHLKKDIRKLKEAARQAARWSDKVEATKTGSRIAGLRPDRGHIGHQAAKMMKRAKSLENRKEAAVREKEGLLKDIETLDSLKLNVLEHHSRRLISLDDIAIRYGDSSPPDGTLQSGDLPGRPHRPVRKERLRQDEPDEADPWRRYPAHRAGLDRRRSCHLLHLPGHLLSERHPLRTCCQIRHQRAAALHCPAETRTGACAV